MLWPNAESDPPECELTKSANGIRPCKRNSVVAANHLRESVLSKQTHEDLASGGHFGALERRAAQQEARVQIEYGQRVAINTEAFSQAELTFEVGRPDHVRLAGSGPRSIECSSLFRKMPSPPMTDQIVPLKQLTNRARCRPVLTWLMLYQPVAQHLRAVERMLSSERYDVRRHLGGDAMEVGLWRMRSIRKAEGPFASKSLQPFLSCLLTDAESIADMNDRNTPIQTSLDERQSFRHG